jgi:hypothetical protein
MPRVGGGTGTATNWRQVNAIIGSGFDAMGWVPEGQRWGQMSYSTSNRSATLVTIGEEDAATFEAISAGREFEDIQARMTFRLLQKMMLKEEMAILSGNASLQLGTPSTPTLSASGAGATLPAGTYFVKVVALTLEGYQNSSVSGGVATTKTVTGVDNKTFTLSGGSSAISAEASQAVTLGQTLFCSVTPIEGAVAYAWYISTSTGTEILQAITTINSLTVSAALVTGTQSQTAFSAIDNSANPSYAYDGLLTTALKNGSNAYVNILPTGTAGTGTTLTSSGRGSVNEIDTMFQTMWNSNCRPLFSMSTPRSRRTCSFITILLQSMADCASRSRSIRGFRQARSSAGPKTCRFSISRTRSPTSPNSRPGRTIIRSTGRSSPASARSASTPKKSSPFMHRSQWA